jgi:hypothetical protein
MVPKVPKRCSRKKKEERRKGRGGGKKIERNVPAPITQIPCIREWWSPTMLH